MIPSLGRIVEYKLNAADAERINKRRDDARSSHVAQQQDGVVVHTGNSVSAGEVYPLVITRVWTGPEGPLPSSLVNGQLLLDGNDTLWVTSVHQGDGEPHGCWREFPRV